MRALEPWIVLFLLPMLIGLGAGMLSRNTRSASLVAMLACMVAMLVCVTIRIPEESWNWLAAFLVLPLPVALALACVLIWHGRGDTRRRARHESRG